MKNSEFKIVHIVEQNNKANLLSKSQKLFNKLIKNIHAGRKLLEAWQTTIPIYQQKYANEFSVRMQTFHTCRTELVHLFDQVYTHKTLSKNEKKKLRDIICNIAAELIIEIKDNDLKIIYNKHSGSDFDTEAEEQENVVKSVMENILGVKFGDKFDIRSPEKTMEHMGEKMWEKFSQQEHIDADRRERHGKRKKSAKTLAKEAKLQEETQNISQSIREVYLKLAKTLHPDTEPNPAERDRKTALMQQVNIAYTEKDLLRLLELQLKVEQIDQATINSITEGRLKYYNKILANQCEQLQHEVCALILSFGMRFNLSSNALSSPTMAMHKLEFEIKKINREITRLKTDLASFKDIKNIKNYLQSYRIPVQEPFENDPFEAMMPYF